MIIRTHLAFAFLTGLLFLNYSPGNEIVFMGILLFSAALVDIDHPGSKIGRKVKVLSKTFNFLFGHRGLFHSFFMAAGLSFVVWWFFDSWWIPFFIGYMGHIILDGFTLAGINLIYPFQKLSLHGFIETGKVIDRTLFFVFIVLSIIKFIS